MSFSHLCTFIPYLFLILNLASLFPCSITQLPFPERPTLPFNLWCNGFIIKLKNPWFLECKGIKLRNGARRLRNSLPQSAFSQSLSELEHSPWESTEHSTQINTLWHSVHSAFSFVVLTTHHKPQFFTPNRSHVPDSPENTFLYLKHLSQNCHPPVANWIRYLDPTFIVRTYWFVLTPCFARSS